jgi:leishmanolysin
MIVTLSLLIATVIGAPHHCIHD